jgi:uncharacterized protein CbrC (UPF0167 family)
MPSPTPVAFRYLEDPTQCWHDEELSACVVCGQSLPGYGFIRLHEEGYDQFHVCTTCLISGRLAERSLRVNQADADSLREQLAARAPGLSASEREALLLACTAEVEQRTPRPAILNEFTWPAHCADYAVFHRRVDADDLCRLAPDGDGRRFLAANVHPDCCADPEGDEVFLDNVWADRLRGFMRFYLWRCPVCSTYLLTCDSD